MKDTATRIYVDQMSTALRIRRLLWSITYTLLFKHTPRYFMGKWRIFLLSCFGAKIGKGCRVAPDCFVWAPWHLTMGNYVCLGDGVDCYSIGQIILDDYSTVSQRSYLCTASHDIRALERPLFSRPIHIKRHAWVCAEAFIGPGVTIEEGSVAGARSVVLKDVPEWTVVAGNPAKAIKRRIITEE